MPLFHVDPRQEGKNKADSVKAGGLQEWLRSAEGLEWKAAKRRRYAQGGSCMVGLSAMYAFFWKVVGTMVALWTAVVVMATCWCAARCRGPLQPTQQQRQRNRRRDLRDGATQTEPEGLTPRLDEMTINSIRSELSRRRLPTTGNKEELTLRLRRSMMQD